MEISLFLDSHSVVSTQVQFELAFRDINTIGYLRSKSFSESN